jgi:hypothetical protein
MNVFGLKSKMNVCFLMCFTKTVKSFLQRSTQPHSPGSRNPNFTIANDRRVGAGQGCAHCIRAMPLRKTTSRCHG